MTPTVHMYRSGETGLFVNSYLVEGEEGVVAIDAPLLLSDGDAFRARFEALRKPLLGVLVTHPHPDHYNTIGELLAGEDAPVIALPDVDREIREEDDAKRAQWGPIFGPEWPTSATFPNRTVADEESIELGDLRFTAWTSVPAKARAKLFGCSVTARARSWVTWPSTEPTATWPTGTRTRGCGRSTARKSRLPACAGCTSDTGRQP